MYFAHLHVRPEDVEGPDDAVDRLFEDGRPAQQIASMLGLILKLDWVRATRALPLEDEDGDEERDDRRSPEEDR